MWLSRFISPKSLLIILIVILLLIWFLWGGSSKPSESWKETLSSFIHKEKKEVESPPSLLKKPNQVPIHSDTYRKWKGEQETCQALEKIYGKPFVSVRPNFLKNPQTGRNLELDCYNDELKIAAEYNGIQHYVYPNPFHKTEEEFQKQVTRDEIKYQLCEDNGVYLITVPYTVPIEEIPEIVWRLTPEVVSKQGYPDLSQYGAQITNSEQPKWIS
jgi:hypothetical protein